MCIRMIKDNIACSYDPSGSLVEQAKNCSEVIVDYEPGDVDVQHFLQEVQTCVANGTNLNLNVKVNYGNYLSGFKTKKELQSALNDISLNEVIKLIALSQHTAERKLEELSMLCAIKA
jgi:hypothetical protein